MKLYSVRTLRWQQVPAKITVHEGEMFGTKSVKIRNASNKGVYTLPRESFMRRFFGTLTEAKGFLAAELRIRLKKINAAKEATEKNLDSIEKLTESDF